jgi:hypothetical protein
MLLVRKPPTNECLLTVCMWSQTEGVAHMSKQQVQRVPPGPSSLCAAVTRLLWHAQLAFFLVVCVWLGAAHKGERSLTGTHTAPDLATPAPHTRCRLLPSLLLSAPCALPAAAAATAAGAAAAAAGGATPPPASHGLSVEPSCLSASMRLCAAGHTVGA